MGVTVHRQGDDQNVEYESVAHVREDVAAGRLQAFDLLWDLIRETWVPLADMTATPYKQPLAPAALPHGASSPSGRRGGRMSPIIVAASVLGLALVAGALIFTLGRRDKGTEPGFRAHR